MTPERWKRIEELYHAARQRAAEERASFLADACGDDESLRREVESLLAEPVSDAFLAEPPVAMPLYESASATMSGRTVGGYRLQALLGAGGMGDVYRAHDSKLERDVAIKMLPRAFTTDPERLARFEREARMLAALNHPNICGIYGLEEADGVKFLILELVEGDTLAEMLSAATASNAAGLPLRTALTLARQIADALEVAHEKGIIHRDLKPANIKVTPDGVVKVLDFGLAKTVAGPAPSPRLTHAPVGAGGTREGAVLGTAAYMSPEQTRGKAVDKRTDIWAFGCVVYEMLSGRIAFGGETVSDTIGKILEREPDWSVLPSDTPVSIRRLLLRCLAKDTKQRLRDIGDVKLEIDAIDEVPPGSVDSKVAPRAPAGMRNRWLPWVALAVLGTAVGVWEVRRAPIIQENPLADAQFSRFTDWEGTETSAAISPDGKFVAFLGDRDGQLDLWVSQVGTGHFLNLTQDIPPLSVPGPILRTLGFSGDGGEIWFTEAGDASAPKWLVPLSGGTPRPFLGQGSATPSWSPDDTRLVFFTNGGGDPLSIANRAGADAQPLVVDKPGFFASGMHNHNPIWSADGGWIYFAHGPEPNEEMNLWRVRPSGSSPEQLTVLRVAANFLAPIDPRTLLYVARGEDGSGPWLWSLDVETKVSRRVTSGLEHYSSVSATLDGRRVVATVSNPTASLWSVPLLDRLAGDRDVQPYALPSARALAPRFGKSSLFYLSGQGAGDGLWRLQDGRASEVWKAANDSLSEPPAVSPDGSRVAIIVRQEGKRRLSVMSADGTNARTLAASITIQGSAGQGSADWSPDGTWIVAAGSDAQGPGLFKIPVDGTAPVRLASGQLVNPVCSPSGALIVYGGPVVGGQVTLLGVKPDGTPVELPPVRARLGGGHRFLPNGAGLVYLPRSQSLDFWLLDLTTNKTRPLTSLSDHGGLNTFDITPDGKSIVFDRSRENSDIVLIDLPK